MSNFTYIRTDGLFCNNQKIARTPMSKGNKTYCVRLFISVITAYVQEKLIFFSFNHHVRGISSLEKI